MRNLTHDEQEVLDALSNAWNLAVNLPDAAVNSPDNRELETLIHAAQNIVLARPAYEQQKERREATYEDQVMWDHDPILTIPGDPIQAYIAGLRAQQEKLKGQ